MSADVFNIIFIIFGCSFISYCSAPFIRKLGERFNILDIPNSRKVHTKPIVRIGGLSIILTFFTSFFLIVLVIGSDALFLENNFKIIIILLGSFLFFLIGIHDDIFKSPPLLRLIVQFFIAFLVSFNGIYFPDFSFYLPYLSDIKITLSPLLSSIFAGIWIVSITNSINWLDGIDGLSSGYCLILTIGLLSIMTTIDNSLGVIFFSCLGGSILGFLIRNFKPAYYIMGDCGSNLLGFSLSTSSLFFLNQLNNNVLQIQYLLLIFSLPVFDMCFVIVNRLFKNRNIFQADRTHIHHRLLDLNFKYEELIFVLYLYSFISISLGIRGLNNYLN